MPDRDHELSRTFCRAIAHDRTIGVQPSAVAESGHDIGTTQRLAFNFRSLHRCSDHQVEDGFRFCTIGEGLQYARDLTGLIGEAQQISVDRSQIVVKIRPVGLPPSLVHEPNR